MSFRRQIARQARWLVLIAVIAVAGVASAIYLLTNQRLASPFASSYTIEAPFTNVSGIVNGLGDAVNVAGVRVGQVSGSFLRGGRGVLRLEIDPGQVPHVYANAHATLVPRTPLKDMQVDLDVGGPPARPLRDGEALPISQTTTPVDSDELLAALDADTRTWIQTMIANLDAGLHGRGRDLNMLLRALSPTVAQTREITDLLAARRHALSRLVHNLALVTQALGSSDGDLRRVVDASNATLGTLASNEAPLERSVALLPGTLRAARRTVRHATTFANVLRPTLDALTPVAHRVPGLLRDSRTLLGSGGGILPVQPVRDFAAANAPLVALLPGATRDLERGIPPLVHIAGLLERVTNMTAYVPGGGDQGYLYWLSWFFHNLDSTVSTQDAHGAVIRGLALVSCSSGSQPSVPAPVASAPIVGALVGQLLNLPAGCQPALPTP